MVLLDSGRLRVDMSDMRVVVSPETKVPQFASKLQLIVCICIWALHVYHYPKCISFVTPIMRHFLRM